MQESPSRSAGDRAAQAIRERIIGGGYRQGQKLTEEECAAALRVSRIVVRDAFAMLTAEGLLVKQVNRGVRVAVFGPDDIRDIYNLRLSLELLCARLCFARGTVPLAAMELCCLNLNRSALSGQGLRTVQEDMAFHAALVDAAGSPRAAAVWHSLQGQMLCILYPVTNAFVEKAQLDQIYGQHRALLDTFAAGEQGAAEALLESHILNSVRLLTSL